MRLLELVPGGRDAYTVVGIDENTALWIEPAEGVCRVLGAGQVTVVRGDSVRVFSHGQHFAVTELGPFKLPAAEAGIPPAVWEQTHAGRLAAQAARAAAPQPEADIAVLVAARADARARKDWAASDLLRDELAARGWRVLDTPDGAVVEPL